MRVQAEILRRPLGGRGDEIAAHPAARHQVQRRHQPRQQIGRVERGRDGRHDAEMPRRLRQQRHQRQRIVLRRPERALQVELGRAAVIVRHEQRILQQEEIEAGALQRLRQLDLQVWLRPVARAGAAPWLLPAMDAEAVAEKPAEMEGLGISRPAARRMRGPRRCGPSHLLRARRRAQAPARGTERQAPDCHWIGQIGASGSLAARFAASSAQTCRIRPQDGCATAGRLGRGRPAMPIGGSSERTRHAPPKPVRHHRWAPGAGCRQAVPRCDRRASGPRDGIGRGIGAGGGNRTPDIQLGKLTFYL